jgi:DNA polymerase III delta subunit
MGHPLSYSDWVRRTGSARPSGAYFFCGPETYLRDAALARIQAGLFGTGEDARMGRDRFYGGEGPLSQVTSALASVGLFTQARLVTLSEAERSGRAAGADRREFLERLRSGLPGSVFVAFSDLSARELERKNDFTRELLQVCAVVEMNHPNQADAMRWLLDESTRRGVPLEADAGALLLARVGPTLQELSREMEKLELWVAPGQSVTAACIEEMVRRGQLGTGWEFCEAVLNGQTSRALRLGSALQRTEPVLRTQWLLQRQARDRQARGGSGRADAAGPIDLLLQAFDLERGIKSGRIASGRDRIALELLVVSSGVGKARPVHSTRSVHS